MSDLIAGLRERAASDNAKWPTEGDTIWWHNNTPRIIARLERAQRIEEAARAHMDAWDAMEDAVEYRRECLHEETHGQIISEPFKAELNTRVREANVVEHRTAAALRTVLDEGSTDA